MSRKMFIAGLAVLSIILALLPSSAFAAVELIGHPRFDEVWMVPISDPSAATTAFQTCDADMYPDMIVWDNVQKLLDENNTILSAPGFHFCYLGINTRSYVPDDAEQPDAGRQLAPLNFTAFRQALAWSALSKEQKEAAILEIYGGPINTACDTVVPPALGVWHDTSVVAPGGNFTKARELLLAGGFYIDGTTLYQPNGEAVRADIEVLSPSAAPTSVAFTQKFVDQWNEFFHTFLGVTNPTFTNNAVDFNAELVPRAFLYRNFDIYFLCWGLGRFPDYLYDFFHSSQDFPWGYNSPGIADPTLDAYLETLKWGLVYEEKLEASYAAQHLIAEELCPYVTIYSRTYYTAFKNYYYYTGEDIKLVNMINMYGVGPDNGWTWSLMHWNTAPQGGSFTYILGEAPESLHPGWADSAYEWDILDRILDGLIATRPDLGDLPWIACNWTVESFTWEPLGITAGTKVRFQLRSDVYWHDGYPVTVEDIQFVLGTSPDTGFIRNFPRYASIYEYLAWTEIVDPCTIDIYINMTSQWILYDLAGVALMWPKHMYGPGGWLETNGYDPVNAPVWEIDYTVGNAKKALIGCGPYIFDEWNPAENWVHIVKNPAYWVDSPIRQNFIAPQRVDPGEEFTYYVELVNTGSKDEATGELTDMIIDYIEITADGEIIDIITGPFVIPPFQYLILGPYTYSFTEKGMHKLDCHTYAYGMLYDEYDHPIWVTIREDLDLNFKVEIKDLAVASRAFGSYPGHPKWNEKADLDDNYKVEIKDVAKVSKMFGWA